LDGAGTGSAANANDPGAVSAGNATSGIGGVSVMSVAVGVGASDAASGSGGTGKASFVAKANFSIALPSGLRFSVLTSTLP